MNPKPLLLLTIILLLAACTADDTGDAAPTFTPEEAQLPEQAQDYITLAKRALAQNLEIDESEIELESITEPATAGGTYIILLNAAGTTFEYHGRNNEVLLVSEPLPTAPSDTPPEPVEGTPIQGPISYTLALVESAEIEINIDAGDPAQLHISGQLRGGCEVLHDSAVTMIDDLTFNVELIVSRPVEAVCTLELRGYEHTIPLPVSDLPAGEYTVTVNDEITTTFLWPGLDTAEIPPQPIIDLTIDEAIFSDTAAETVLAVEGAEGQPFWEIYPTYTAITLTGYIHNQSLQTARLYIYPLEELAAVNDTAAIEIEALRQLLEEQPDLAQAETLPYLPLTGAAQMLHAQAAYIEFGGDTGRECCRGIRYLTQYAQGASPVNNQELVYTFQGLTHDDNYYIAAVLPVSHPDLPADINAYPGDFGDEFETYLANMTEQLNAADPASFTPDLTVLDEIIASITISPPETAVHSEADLVFTLEEAGATVALNTEPTPAASILSVPGNVINVNGEQLQVYAYDSPAAAQTDAARISADGYEIAPAEGDPASGLIIDWAAPPHFFRWDNLIILYIGDDPALLTLLTDLFTPPFAGG